MEPTTSSLFHLPHHGTRHATLPLPPADLCARQAHLPRRFHIRGARSIVSDHEPRKRPSWPSSHSMRPRTTSFGICRPKAKVAVTKIFRGQRPANFLDQAPQEHEQIFFRIANDLELIAGPLAGVTEVRGSEIAA